MGGQAAAPTWASSAKEESGHQAAPIDHRILQALASLQGADPPNLRKIASGLNLSYSRFRHLFKRELGIPPRRYARCVQLEQAKRLLESSFLRVKEVAALVNANDISHFVRDYKSHFGRTPSQTRRNLCPTELKSHN